MFVSHSQDHRATWPKSSETPAAGPDVSQQTRETRVFGAIGILKLYVITTFTK